MPATLTPQRSPTAPAGAVPATWRALLVGPWHREMPVWLRRSRFLIALYALYLDAAASAGVLTARPDGWCLTTTVAPDWGAAVRHINPQEYDQS